MSALHLINSSHNALEFDQQLLLRLKQETRPQHDAIERVPLMASLFEPSFSLDSYTRLLSAQLHFYRPYEAMLKQYQHVVQSIHWCSKAPLLEADLTVLQFAGSNDQPDAQVEPLLEHPARMLGVMYVFEGATLGGAVIRKQLERTIGSQIAGATNFYDCYGEHRMLQWKSFQQLLSRVVSEHPEWSDDIVLGARMTFIAMTAWLAQFTHQE